MYASKLFCFATENNRQPFRWMLFAEMMFFVRFGGYETDERSSLGKAALRCRWQIQQSRFFRSGRNSAKRKASKEFREPQGGPKG